MREYIVDRDFVQINDANLENIMYGYRVTSF